MIGKCVVPATGGATVYKDVSCPITSVKGAHMLYIVGSNGTDIANIDRISLVMVK
jgi:hypothetical protein